MANFVAHLLQSPAPLLTLHSFLYFMPDALSYRTDSGRFKPCSSQTKNLSRQQGLRSLIRKVNCEQSVSKLINPSTLLSGVRIRTRYYQWVMDRQDSFKTLDQCKFC
jgi:hypothetical protein